MEGLEKQLRHEACDRPYTSQNSNAMRPTTNTHVIPAIRRSSRLRSSYHASARDDYLSPKQRLHSQRLTLPMPLPNMIANPNPEQRRHLAKQPPRQWRKHKGQQDVRRKNKHDGEQRQLIALEELNNSSINDEKGCSKLADDGSVPASEISKAHPMPRPWRVAGKTYTAWTVMYSRSNFSIHSRIFSNVQSTSAWTCVTGLTDESLLLEKARARRVVAAVHQIARGMLMRRAYFMILRKRVWGLVGGSSKRVWIVLLVEVASFLEGEDVDGRVADEEDGGGACVGEATSSKSSTLSNAIVYQ
jgi:hypothetical protein